LHAARRQRRDRTSKKRRLCAAALDPCRGCADAPKEIRNRMPTSQKMDAWFAEALDCVHDLRWFERGTMLDPIEAVRFE